MAVQTKIQVRRDTADNWATAQTAAGATPILAAGEIGYITSGTGAGSFKIGDGSSVWGSLKLQSDASLLTGAASLTTLTTSGAVVIGGDLTVNGTTTSINSSTLTVDDKNIELGSVAAITGRTGTAATGNTTITASNTAGMITNQTITRTAGAAMTTGTVVSIINATAFTVSSAPSASGSITFDTGGPTNTTAEGAGINVAGSLDVRLFYGGLTYSNNWVSTQGINLSAAKSYWIDGSVVLSATQVLGYGIASTNTASNVVARDNFGNFAANTVTASLTGTASLATNMAGGSAGQLLYQSAANVTAELAVTATNNQVLSYNTATNAPQWTAITGTGNVVYSTSPVLTTPNIGTPSFATLTNATGYKVDSLANTGTSVIGALQVAVGTAGAFVVNGGALGTPSSANLSSATGYAISNLASIGTNVATFLTTPTSANFLTTVTGATGNGGGVVFANNATLVAPTLGVASATSLNKVTFTAPATAATLTLANGSTLQTIGAFFINATATANTDITFPTGGTLANTTFVGSATVAQANNLTGATANLIPYQSAANTTSFIAAPGGANYVLTASQTGAPTWAAPQASVTAGNGINVSSGTVSINTAYATTWTTTQRVNVSSDVVAFGIKAHSTQTSNLVEVLNNAGTTTLMSLSGAGTLFAVTIDGGSA